PHSPRPLPTLPAPPPHTPRAPAPHSPRPRPTLPSLSRFPIPDSRFPIPDSRFPIPDSRQLNTNQMADVLCVRVA
ncbi:MAG: ParA family protein, partial [Moorea sp. SIO4E2]